MKKILRHTLPILTLFYSSTAFSAISIIPPPPPPALVDVFAEIMQQVEVQQLPDSKFVTVKADNNVEPKNIPPLSDDKLTEDVSTQKDIPSLSDDKLTDVETTDKSIPVTIPALSTDKFIDIKSDTKASQIKIPSLPIQKHLKFKPEEKATQEGIPAIASEKLSSIEISNNDYPTVKIFDIAQTVVKMSLQKGITINDASQAMISKASELNLKLVGRQKIHEELKARGVNSPYIEILQFCAPEDAMKMVLLDPLYSAYIPCRISLTEDSAGKPWLFMLNLDMLINNNSLSPELQAIAIRVNRSMLSILTAGATGEF